MTENDDSPLILIIDDDPLFRSTVSRMAQCLGYTVMEATSGAEGIAVVRESGVAVALIDMLMPDLDGFETIRKIRETDEQVQIIAMSGGSLATDGSYWDPLQPARALCADQILNKPFGLDSLQVTIEAGLRKREDSSGTRPRPDERGAC